MPPEAPRLSVPERVAELNRRYRGLGASYALARALKDPQVGRVAMASSFGVESAALLHMISAADPSVPVLLIDTGKHFDETLAYQTELAERLGLTDVRVIRPDRRELFRRDPDGILHLADPDACCRLRKIEPFRREIEGFDAWINGLKRFQGGIRRELPLFEDDGGMRIKLNPLANWTRDDVRDYLAENRLPRHPLAMRGYASIGCTPCTTPVGAGEDGRAGRWRGFEKMECGIHFVGSALARDDAARIDEVQVARQVEGNASCA